MGLLTTVPKNTTLSLAGELIARFVENHGSHPVARHIGGNGPAVWFCGATANLAANLAQLYPNLRIQLHSEVADDTFGRAQIELARLYGLDTKGIKICPPGIGGSIITPLYRMPLACGDTTNQVADFFTRAHGPLPTLWNTSRIQTEQILEEAGGVFFDGIFASLSNLRSNPKDGPAEIARSCFEAAKERGIVRFFDTNRRASLWASKPEISYTAQLYTPFFEMATVVTGSVGLLLPMVNRLEDFSSNNFGKRCIAELRNGETSKLLTELLQQVFEKFPRMELIGVTVREELLPGRHRMACCVATRGAHAFAFSPVLEIGIVDRPGMGDAAASVLIGACFNPDSVPQTVVNRMAGAFAFAGMTVGDIPPHRGLAYLEQFLPSDTAKEVVR